MLDAAKAHTAKIGHPFLPCCDVTMHKARKTIVTTGSSQNLYQIDRCTKITGEILGCNPDRAVIEIAHAGGDTTNRRIGTGTMSWPR